VNRRARWPRRRLGETRRVACSHFSVDVRGSRRCSSPARRGPRSFGTPIDTEALGGLQIQIIAGGVDTSVDSEDEAFDQIRRFLATFPERV